MRKTDKEDKNARRAKIRALNDAFRKTFRGGRVVMTAGVAALTDAVQRVVFQKIQEFDAFDDENDPWGEHDFVSVEHDDQTYFAKIDLLRSQVASPFRRCGRSREDLPRDDHHVGGRTLKCFEASLRRGLHFLRFANRVRGKNSLYSSSLNHAHLMSKSFKPGTRIVSASA